jgi:branched-chain amino acid transport system substrate-binding protein
MADQRKLGIILPLSGPVAEVGESIKNNIELSREDFDPEGKVKVIYEDDQFQPKNSVNAMWKLIEIEKVDAVITFGGSTSNAVSEIAEKKEVPMLAITALSTIGRGKQNVRSIFLSANGQSQLYVNELAKRNQNKISLITNTQDALLHIRDGILKEFKGEVLNNEEVTPGEQNISSIVTKLRVKKPEAILLLTLPPHNSMFAKQLRNQGFKGQFYGGPPMFNPSEIKTAEGALEGALFPGPKSESLKSYSERYVSKYSKSPISEGLYGYDAGKLMINSLKAENIKEFIKNTTSITGLSGEYKLNDSNSYEIPVEIREIKGEMK